MTVLGSILNRSGERPSAGLPAWGDWTPSSGGTTWAGQNVSVSSSVQLLTVYGCARFIADGISTLPIDDFRRRPDGSPEEVRPPQWLEEPTSELDFTAWAGQKLLSLLLDGNAYSLMHRAGGSLLGMEPLDPALCEPDRQNGRKTILVNGERHSTFQVAHIPGLMWPGSVKGLSPVEAARQTIGQGMSAQEYGARFFGQGAALSGVIETSGDLNDTQAKVMAKAWKRAHSGPNNANLPGVLSGGAVWKPTGVTNEQSQFLETRKFTASEIAAQMFLIDPAEMGLPVDGSSLTYANLEQRNARKVQVTFLPWITRLENFLSYLLPRPQYVKFNVNGLLRGDMKTRFESYAIGIRNQFMVPNEARDFEDWMPLDGGDVPPTELPAAGGTPT